ncbi:hypothetical protein RI367_005323 [Sorochytrium milnesiophthora]
MHVVQPNDSSEPAEEEPLLRNSTPAPEAVPRDGTDMPDPAPSPTPSQKQGTGKPKKKRDRKRPMKVRQPVYADPASREQLYTNASPFRPFYFKSQDLPVPEDMTVPTAALVPVQENIHWAANIPRVDGASMSLFSRIHVELGHLYSYAAANKAERMLRLVTLERFKVAFATCPQQHANFDVRMFGSSCSDVESNLPNSDIDLGLCPKSHAASSWAGLAPEDRKEMSVRHLDGIMFAVRQISSKRYFVRHARHPVIKYVDAVTGIDVDVSVQIEGMETVDIVRGITEKYPAMRPVVLFLKLLFRQHNMHDSSTGGMGGYCCISVVYGMLKRLEAQGHDVDDAGLLLLMVAHFYGFVLDSQQVGIDIVNGGALFHRGNHLSKDVDSRRALMVTSVRDQNPPENVGRNISKWREFRVLFQHVFLTLMTGISRDRRQPQWPSILLTSVLDFPPDVLKARKHATVLWQSLLTRATSNQAAMLAAPEDLSNIEESIVAAQEAARRANVQLTLQDFVMLTVEAAAVESLLETGVGRRAQQNATASAVSPPAQVDTQQQSPRGVIKQREPALLMAPAVREAPVPTSPTLPSSKQQTTMRPFKAKPDSSNSPASEADVAQYDPNDTTPAPNAKPRKARTTQLYQGQRLSDAAALQQQTMMDKLVAMESQQQTTVDKLVAVELQQQTTMDKLVAMESQQQTMIDRLSMQLQQQTMMDKLIAVESQQQNDRNELKDELKGIKGELTAIKDSIQQQQVDLKGVVDSHDIVLAKHTAPLAEHSGILASLQAALASAPQLTSVASTLALQ